MKKNLKWLVIFNIVIFMLQLINSVLCYIINNSICAAITGFGSGIAFLGMIVMYDQYKNCEE